MALWIIVTLAAAISINAYLDYRSETRKSRIESEERIARAKEETRRLLILSEALHASDRPGAAGNQ